MEVINKAVSAGLNTVKEAAAKATEQAATEATANANRHEEASKAAAVFTQETPAGGEQATSSQPAGRASGARSFRIVLLADAMAKPISDRDEEELLISAKAGKVRKIEQGVADVDLPNV